VLDANLPSLLAIDPETGTRENISGGPQGSGVAFQTPLSMHYDEAGDRVLVVDGPNLIAVDLEDGERSLISGAANEGPAVMHLAGVVLDAPRSRAIVRDGELGVVEIDLTTGDRRPLVEATALSNEGGGSDLLYRGMGELSYDAERRTLLLLEVMPAPALVEVDELTGDRTVLLGRVP
jgi:hypothetical protein